MLEWWRWCRQARQDLEREARALIKRAGEGARWEATEEMVRTARGNDFEANARWTRIRYLIDREAGYHGEPEAWAKAPSGVFGI